MLADAFAAERLRLGKARGLLFWGFLFVPIVSLAFGLLGTVITVATRRMPSDPGLAFAANDLAKSASEAMTQTDLIPVQLFFMLAAAALVADDYRWETWRLVTPRNTRANLLLAKLMTFGVGAASSILLLAVLSMVSALIDGLATGDGFTSTYSFSTDLIRLGGSFATSWLELMAMAALAMLLTVLTRNAIPAVIGSIGLWAVQLVAIDRLPGAGPVDGRIRGFGGLGVQASGSDAGVEPSSSPWRTFRNQLSGSTSTREVDTDLIISPSSR
jgi:ABC-2 type transport system permease protein